MKVARLSCTVLSLTAASVLASPPVNVKLQTSWPAAPLLLEILEAIYIEEPSSFYPLVNAVVTSREIPPIDSLAPEAIEEVVFSTARSLGFLQEPGSLEAARLHIALHSPSPKIQAFFQFHAEQNLPSSSVTSSSCESWVDWYGERVCDSETLARLAEHVSIEASEDETSNLIYTRPQLLPIDHITPDPTTTLETPPRTAIFYANIESSNFRELHSLLYHLATAPQPRLEYVFRHIPNPSRNKRQGFLSGYGVALDLKKTDYLVLDDRHSHNASNDEEGSLAESEDSIINTLLNTYPEISLDAMLAPLMEDEIRGLSMKATQLIANSSNPLETLLELSQNFPKYASELAHRVVLNETLVDEVQDNYAKAQGGVNMMWMNGLTVDEKEINPPGLLHLLRKERAIMHSLASLGLSPSQSIDLLTHKSIYSAQQHSAGALDGIFDASDRPEGGDVITWWNDMTKDSRYAKWNPSLSGLLRQVYPGSFHNIKQNLFNVVLVLDLSKTTSVRYIAGTMNTIINRGFPLRFGVVPNVETEDGAKMARLVRFLIKEYGRSKTMILFSRIAQFQLPPDNVPDKIDWRVVEREYTDMPRSEGQAFVNFESVLDGTWKPEPLIVEGENESETIVSTEEDYLDKAKLYATRLDATSSAFALGHAFVNGKHFDMDDSFTKSLQLEMQTITQHFQEKLYFGALTESSAETIDTYFYDLPEASPRRNRYIYPSVSKGASTLPGTSNLQLINLPELLAKTDLSLPDNSYIYPASDSGPIHSSILVVTDLDSVEGKSFAAEALAYLKGDAEARLTFIHNPAHTDKDNRHDVSSIMSCLVHYPGALSSISAEHLITLLEYEPAFTPGKEPHQVHLSEESTVRQALERAGVSLRTIEENDNYKEYTSASRLLARHLGLAPGDIAIVINGRVIGPIEPETFKAADFVTLVGYEHRRRTGPIVKALANITITPESMEKHNYANLVSMSSAIIASVQQPDPSEQGLFNVNLRPRQRNYRLLSSNFTSFSTGDPNSAIYHVAVLLDPITESAQKWTVFLQWLSEIPSVHLQVYLNPGTHSEVPLKRFYRYTLPHTLQFDKNGNEVDAEIKFEDIPVAPIYTLALDEAHSWFVRPREAAYDLDNLQLSKLAPEDKDRGVSALFQLDYLVIEGYARDTVTNGPPRGLQLQLSTLDGNPVDDTLVVLNMGYLQFKARPGVYQLEIREGRGREVYRLASAGNEGWNSPTVEASGNTVTLTGFDGLTLYPRASRNPGMENVDVLSDEDDEDDEDESVFSEIASKFKSLFGKIEPKIKSIESRQADINIFTVASGHLYERFASIMILSVLKNTNSTVKFWFIENFLSPSFLEFLPHYASVYNFEYELVTYKWPSWLRAQREKQRIIWAYKILFLDVLFPMDLKKVIFVDADQIVRTDLQELVDLDLKGAPYGYTPMGNDNEEMEGFRFWKTGYWEKFLNGRPYHISALYVVDLERFRQFAAGDILRGQYQALSQDPNSLANLDQDLPNNLQREVPIFSLHEDWLWCETWCSKDRLDRAKTIDLCQNPLTKEPKLVRARKIPEWEAYDTEIADFARSLAERGSLGSENAKGAIKDVQHLAGSAGSNGASAEVETPAVVAEPEVRGSAPSEEHTKDEL